MRATIYQGLLFFWVQTAYFKKVAIMHTGVLVVTNTHAKFLGIHFRQNF